MRSGLRSLLCAVLLIASVQTIEAQAIARLSSQPPLSPAEVAELETRVQSEPGDIATRIRLLTHYRDFAPAEAHSNPVFRAARLRHILYLIEHSPGNELAASPLAYVYASGGPYADAADHELARNAWLRAADSNRTNASVQVNTARFLYVEHPDDAEEFLRRLVDQDPSNRLLASHLGFFYAMDILGMNGPFGTRGRGPSDAERLGAQARGELERTTNPLVLAAAATALPNLFMRSRAGRAPGGDPTVFQYSSTLMARARQLAPGEPELRGPMPLIREFGQFTGSESGQPSAQLQPSMTDTPMVRVGPNVQERKLLQKPEPVYPAAAREARIQGIVRFNVLLSADGAIENAQLVSGHPLLIAAAQEALRGYRYEPTLLNGSPARVVTLVDIRFTLQ